MNVNTDPLAEEYLRRLEAAAVVLRNVLDRLGPPDEIVDAAADPEPSDRSPPCPS